MPRISKELKELEKIFSEEEKINEEALMESEINKDFILRIKENAIILTDTREVKDIVHSLESILLTVIFGIIANCNTFLKIYLFMLKRQDWLEKHIKYDSGLPSLSTIKRVIGMINPRELEELCNDSFKIFLTNNEPYYKDENLVIEDIKSMDGKTANSSDRKTSKMGEISKTNAMSVVSLKHDYCEATEFIESKTNEIPTGVDLLKRINIEGSIVVFDAMSTQTDTISYIHKENGYYIAPVKGNHPTLEEDIILYFKDDSNYQKEEGKNYLKTVEKAHGNVETREYLFVNDVDWLYNKENWLGLKSIGMVTRSYIDKNNQEVKDTRYYISNLPADKINLLSKAVRGEWHIENGLHLYLDMVFEEDKNKCFLKESQKNLNIIRKFCLGILKKYKQQTKLSMESIRFNISMDFENEIDTIFKSVFYL